MNEFAYYGFYNIKQLNIIRDCIDLNRDFVSGDLLFSLP